MSFRRARKIEEPIHEFGKLQSNNTRLCLNCPEVYPPGPPPPPYGPCPGGNNPMTQPKPLTEEERFQQAQRKELEKLYIDACSEIDALRAENKKLDEAGKKIAWELGAAKGACEIGIEEKEALRERVAELEKEWAHLEQAKFGSMAQYVYKLESSRDKAEAEVARLQDVIRKMQESVQYCIDGLATYKEFHSHIESTIGKKPWSFKTEERIVVLSDEEKAMISNRDDRDALATGIKP